MILPVSLFLGLAAMVVSYALGQGGPIAAIFFLLFLTGGAIIRYAEPLRNKLKP